MTPNPTRGDSAPEPEATAPAAAPGPAVGAGPGGPDPAGLPEWLRGERARPTAPALAGAAGALVALAGLSFLFDDIDSDDVRAVGLALSLLTLLVGYGLMLLGGRGALRTAGVGLAAGAAFPSALVLVNDPTEIDSRTDVMLAVLVAVLVWLLLFAFGAARGHGLFLGLALLGAWSAAVSQTAPESSIFWFTPMTASERVTARPEVLVPPTVSMPDRPIPTFTVPNVPTPTITLPAFSEPIFPVPSFPEPTTGPPPTFPPFPTFPEYEQQEQQQEQSLAPATLAASTQPFDEDDDRPRPPVAHAVVSMLFGALYLAAAGLLDGARLTRPAGAFVAVGVPVLAFGVVSLGPRHGSTVVAVAGLVFGLALSAVGVRGGRRFSGWAGAAVSAAGVVGLVGEAFDGSGSGDAVALLLVAAAFVAGGWFLSQPLAPGRPHEPADQAAHDSSS